MKLYGIHKGSVHEGGGMGYNVYTDKQRVREICRELVKDEQLHDNEIWWDDPDLEDWTDDMIPVDKWEEVSEGRWTNGIEEIKIQELELITETDSSISISSDSNGTIKL